MNIRLYILISLLPALCLCDNNLTGTKAPKWALKTSDGSYEFLNNYVAPIGEDLIGGKREKRSVIVQTFFATWCSNCARELSELDRLRKLFTKENIEFFIIDLTEYTRRSTDPEHRQAENSSKFLDDLGFSKIPVLMDDDGITARAYGFDELVLTLPRLIIIDKYQQIRFDETGACTKCFDDEIVPLIKKLVYE
jgi:thiol-disulfide isomerase/thioredoxin